MELHPETGLLLPEQFVAATDTVYPPDRFAAICWAIARLLACRDPALDDSAAVRRWVPPKNSPFPEVIERLAGDVLVAEITSTEVA